MGRSGFIASGLVVLACAGKHTSDDDDSGALGGAAGMSGSQSVGGAASGTGAAGENTGGGNTGGENTGGGDEGGGGGTSGATSGGMGGTSGSGGASAGMLGMPAGAGGASAGVAGSAGSSGGAAGSGGGRAGNGDPLGIAKALDGQVMLARCAEATADLRVCKPVSKFPNCRSPASVGYQDGGAGVFDRTLTLGGETGTRYAITLRFQGIVEAKTYNGGTDQDRGEQIPADGFYIGPWTATGSGNAYAVYRLKAAAPLAGDYYLNSIGTLSPDTRVRHSTFPVDYFATIVAEGGTTIRLTVGDPTCSMIKNCADPDTGIECHPQTFAGLDPVIAAAVGPQPYDGQFLGMRVIDVSLAP